MRNCPDMEAVLDNHVYYMVEKPVPYGWWKDPEDVYYDSDHEPRFDTQEFMVWDGKKSECVLTQKQIEEAICQYEGVDEDPDDVETRIQSMFAFKGKIYLFYEVAFPVNGQFDNQVGVLIYEPGKKLTTDENFKTFYQFLNQHDYLFYDISFVVDGQVYLAEDEYIGDCYVYDFSLGKYQTITDEEFELLVCCDDPTLM